MSARILGLLLLASAIGRGQSSTPSAVVGIVGGFDAGGVRATFPIYDGGAECGTFGGGRSLGGRLGATIVLPSFFSSDLGLSGSLAGSLRFGRFTAPLPSLLLFDAELHRGVYAAHEQRYATQERSLQLEVLGTWDIGGILRLKAGPWGEYRFFTSASQVDAITDATYRFPGGKQEMAIGTGSRLTPVVLGGGITAAVEYVGSSRSGWSIVPSLVARTSLFSERAEVSWNTTTLGVGIGLYFARGGEEVREAVPSPPPPDSSVSAPLAALPHPADLTASLHLHGVDSAGRALSSVMVSVREIARRDLVPIDPVLPLDRRGGIAAGRFAPLAAEKLTTFTPDSLIGGSVADYARRAVDVIGFRLRASSSAMLKLRISESVNDGGGAMAEAIRSYLHESWGIDASRIAVVRSRGVAGGRIELAGNPASLIAPMAAERIDRELDPPMIALDPVYSSGAGIRRWEITLRHGATLLGRLGSDVEGARSLRWQIASDDTLLAPLVADLMVEDSAGHVATARDQAPLTLRKSRVELTRRILPGGEGEELLATLFGEEPGSRALGAGNLALLREIAEMVHPGARITIVPPDDNSASRELAGRILDRLRGLLPSTAGHTAIVIAGKERAPGVQMEDAGTDPRVMRVSIAQSTMR